MVTRLPVRPWIIPIVGLAFGCGLVAAALLYSRGRAPTPPTELEAIDPEYVNYVEAAIQQACRDYPSAPSCQRMERCE